jgi:gluconokinase
LSLERLVPESKKLSPEIFASGSFRRSELWVQMMADVFGHPVTLPSEPEGSAFGAAALGMLAIGELTSLQDVKRLMNPPKKVYQPNKDNHALYRRLFSIYEKVYQDLVPEFDAIAKLQHELFSSQNNKSETLL